MATIKNANAMKHKLTIVISLIFSILTLCSCQQSGNNREESHETEADGNNPLVYLTVSSLASHPNIEERLLELNWYNAPPGINESENSRVELFSHDPQDNISNPLVSVKPWHHVNGYYRTSVQFPKHVFTEYNMTDGCLDFWIAYVNDGQILSSSCIQALPHWMLNSKKIIGNVSLMDLMIPGTHNAGSYAYFDPSDDTIFNRYLITQDESIFNQLVYGIRYLDLRVSYQTVSGVNDRLWITHGAFRTDIPVREVIAQVKAFLNVTKEIVIMDFHRFVTGFNGRRASTRHRQLITMLERELIDYIIPVAFTSWATLNELWNANKRLYVGYASNSERQKSRFLFPDIKHLWGDVDKVDELLNYLNGSVCNRRQKRLNSAMAQLTPSTAGAIFDIYGGLRKMADDVNRHVTMWFRDMWWQCANIISTDYFLGNNIIQTAIETNKNRFTTEAGTTT